MARKIFEIRTSRTPKPDASRIARGMLAGLIGGIVGSVAKSLGEMLYEPRTSGQTPPPVVLAERFAGHPLSAKQKSAGMLAIHFLFGGMAGAVYGAAAEASPFVTRGCGCGFGVVLQLMTHETLVPAAGLDKPALEQPLREHASELFTHILYGLATESVRRLVREKLA